MEKPPKSKSDFSLISSMPGVNEALGFDMLLSLY
jgi:hypothetical protein